jgi:hypothetical protein
MPHTDSLLRLLQKDFPAYGFTKGAVFKWSPTTQQIIYADLSATMDKWALIHELAHAELAHHDYDLDIELVGQEAAAWEYARSTLSPRYHLFISEDYIQDNLDSYRQWLHKRSTCLECGQNGLQTSQNTYRCINCRCSWRVNDARMCRLRRTRLRQPS